MDQDQKHAATKVSLFCSSADASTCRQKESLKSRKTKVKSSAGLVWTPQGKCAFSLGVFLNAQHMPGVNVP